MTITDVQLAESSITFFLAGDMSLGSAPVIDLLIRRSQKLGLSVHLDVSGITEADAEMNRFLSGWRAEGVKLSGSGSVMRVNLEKQTRRAHPGSPTVDSTSADR